MTYMDVCLILFISSCIFAFIWRWMNTWNYSLEEKTIVFFERLVKFLGLGFMVAAVLLGLFGGLIYG